MRRSNGEGQTTVEYLFLLAIASLFALIAVKGLLQPIYEEVSSRMSESVRSRLTEGVHRYPIGSQ